MGKNTNFLLASKFKMIHKQKRKTKDKSTELSETKPGFVPPLPGICHRETPEAAPADAGGEKSSFFKGYCCPENSVYTAGGQERHSSAGGTVSTTLHSTLR